jgi:hypothetical protein
MVEVFEHDGFVPKTSGRASQLSKVKNPSFQFVKSTAVSPAYASDGAHSQHSRLLAGS